jgi:hypothetical protein
MFSLSSNQQYYLEQQTCARRKGSTGVPLDGLYGLITSDLNQCVVNGSSFVSSKLYMFVHFFCDLYFFEAFESPKAKFFILPFLSQFGLSFSRTKSPKPIFGGPNVHLFVFLGVPCVKLS